MNRLTRCVVTAMPLLERNITLARRIPMPKPASTLIVSTHKFQARKYASKPSQSMSSKGDSSGNIQNTGWLNSINTGTKIKVGGGTAVIALIAAGLGWWYCNENPEENICTDARKFLDLPPIKKK